MNKQHVWVIGGLSFASVLPLVLIGATLQAWYTVAGVNLLAIGALTLVGQPYVYKFLWAPVIDRYIGLPGFGRRRGWMLLLQGGLVISLLVLATCKPQETPLLMGWVALCIAFLSASQDIAIDGYRVDLLKPAERSAGAAWTTIGGRVGMLVGGALALVLADQYGFAWVYVGMAGLMLGCMGLTLGAPREPVVRVPGSLREAIRKPLSELFTRPQWGWVLVCVVGYKVSDALALALNTPFLIRGVGFSLLGVGTVYKSVSILALFIGSIVGAVWLRRLGLYRGLWTFGLLQALAHGGYAVLALVGPRYPVMVCAVFCEYFASSLGTVAFVAFLLGLCHREFSATQYALLSAVMAIPRVLAGPLSAWMVMHWGWFTFYLGTVIVGLPILAVLPLIRSNILSAEARV